LTPVAVPTTVQQEGSGSPTSPQPPPLKRFKFLAQSLQSSAPISTRPDCTAADELADYINNMPFDADESITWWLKKKRGSREVLPPLAIDILAVPSSEAFVERVFSL